MNSNTPPSPPLHNTSSVDAATRTVVIERVFDASPRQLFVAYSKPAHLKRFFGPPGYPLTTCDVDFQVGGRFRFQMTGPDGVKGPFFGGTYRAISAHDRIQYDNGFFVDGGTDAERDPAPEQQMAVTLAFVAEGDATRLIMTTVFGSQAMFEEHTGMGYVVGCNAGLDQLRDLLPSMLQELA